MSTLQETKSAVEGYTTGWIAKTMPEARRWLADDLDFQGAVDRFTRADELCAAVERLLPAITRVDRHVSMYEPGAGFLLYDIHWGGPMAAMKPLRCAEYFEVEGDKVVRIRLVFDATELRAMMSPPG